MSMFTSWWQKAKDLWNKWFGKDETPVPADPLAGEKAKGFDVTKLDTCSGPSIKSAAVCLKLTSCSVNSADSMVSIKSEKRDGWPLNDDGGCSGMIYMYRRQSDGYWRGGKFDWLRKGSQDGDFSKVLENIHGGYGGHTVPASGEEVAFVVVSVDGKKRSNAGFCNW